jgi:MFS superfamily sulfate permease-like transporter
VLLLCVLPDVSCVQLLLGLLQLGSLSVVLNDTLMSGFSTAAAVLLDIDWGLAVGVAAALVCLLALAQRLHFAALGKVPGTHVFLDTKLYQAVSPLASLCCILYIHTYNCTPLSYTV